jgi:hypothetical protein
MEARAPDPVYTAIARRPATTFFGDCLPPTALAEKAPS